jgi:hypothetical protein
VDHATTENVPHFDTIMSQVTTSHALAQYGILAGGLERSTLRAKQGIMELLLDMHKYEGVNVSKCGLECDNLINRGLDRKPFLFSSFDSFVRKGLVQFPLFLWIPVSYCV